MLQGAMKIHLLRPNDYSYEEYLSAELVYGEISEIDVHFRAAHKGEL